MKIEQFQDEYRFLSNFYPSPFKLGEYTIEYSTVEHYYQSQKCANKNDAINIIKCRTPGQAKRLGSTVSLISVWEETKDLVMETGVKAKFDQNADLAVLLISTHPSVLIEGNYWHDNYWGKCYCHRCRHKRGLNVLGKILMEMRGKLINEENRIIKGG